MQNDLKSLVAAVEKARADVVDAVAGLTEEQGVFQPGGAWSIAEVIEHLYLAELSGVAKMWEAAEAFRLGRRWEGELPHRGRSMERIIAETWKPKEEAPPIATPRGEGPFSFWLATFRALSPIVSDLAMRLDGAPLDAVVFPHFLSGPLDARQRLEFLRYHMERHLLQINRIRDSSDFPRGRRIET